MKDMKTTERAFAFCAVLLAVSPEVMASAFSKDLVIAERGKPAAYGIVLPAAPTDSQRFAAKELAEWTRRLTDVELSVSEGGGGLAHNVYLIEPERQLNLGDDGFNIRAVGEDVYVRGGRRGVIYGVYELLETYGGIGWFGPERTVVPTNGVFKVPDSLYDTQKPAFDMRMHDWLWAFDRDYSKAESKRSFYIRLRMNGTTNANVPDEMGGLADASRIVDGAGLCHTFFRLVPPKEYFGSHPEYYSEINGIRHDGESQLCLTNPEVLEVLVSNLVKKIDASPGAKVYGVSQEDWFNYCTCEKCKAVDAEEGSHAGTLIRFVNAVAERVEKVRPGLYCETLAYQYTRKPPKTRPRDNVMICFCNIECDWSRPLSAMATPENRSFVEDFIGWTALTDKLYFWDYTTNYWWPFHFYPNLNSMQENMRFFRDYGVKWLFEEGGYRYADFAPLKCWMLAKWMWNPELPRDELLDRFCKGYYGAAAPYVRLCIETVHQALSAAPESAGYGSVRRLATYEGDRPGVYTDKTLVDCLRLWRQAEKAAADDAGALANVKAGEAGTVAMVLDRAAARQKFVWVTRNPERFGTFKEVMAPYRWMTNWVAEVNSPHLRPAFGSFNSSNTWARAARIERPTAGADVATVGVDCLQLKHLGTWCEIVNDADSTSGRAIRMLPVQDSPCAVLSMRHVAYDDTEYRIRIRLKVDKPEGTKGEAFFVKMRNGELEASRNAEEISETGYAWYDVGNCKLTDAMSLECGIGRYSKGGGRQAVNGVSLDAVEISRVEK